MRRRCTPRITAGSSPGWTAFERSWASLDSSALARVAGELAAKKVAIIPTLVLHETFSRLDDSTVLQDSMLQAVPDAERQRWNVPDMIKRAGWSDADFAAFRRSRPTQDLFLRLFAAAGGNIAAGTDAANQLLIPGYSEHLEMAASRRRRADSARRAPGRDPERRAAPRRGLTGSDRAGQGGRPPHAHT